MQCVNKHLLFVCKYDLAIKTLTVFFDSVKDKRKCEPNEVLEIQINIQVQKLISDKNPTIFKCYKTFRYKVEH